MESAQQAAKDYDGEDYEDNENEDMVDSEEDVEYEISDIEDTQDEEFGELRNHVKLMTKFSKQLSMKLMLYYTF